MIASIYGDSRGWSIRSRTVLVEGTTDEKLYQLAADHEKKNTGVDLLADLAIVAAGYREDGGTLGVVRQLIVMRSITQFELTPNGHPRYRFIGLVDNDNAGRQAIKKACALDASILEYRNMFRLRPTIMPCGGSIDPKSIKKITDSVNVDYERLDWELEDLLLESFVKSFLKKHPTACEREIAWGDKVHRKYTREGKVCLHRYIHKKAKHEDLRSVVEVIRWLRFCLHMPKV